MTISTTTSKAARLLRVRYILGLSAIALLVTASFLTMQRVVSEQRNYSQLVNLASHQSGLANRIAYFASLMATTEDEAEFGMARSQVGRTINKMKTAHRILREGAPAEGIPQVTSEGLQTIYDDPMVGLDFALKRFLDRARRVYDTDQTSLQPGSAAYIFLTTYGPHVLEPMLDAAVEEYGRIGREAILAIERLELGIWIAALCTLLLEVLIIFRPLEARIRQSIASLEETVAELKATRERLLAAQQLALVGDWQWSPASDELSWSSQAYRIYGVSPNAFSPTWESSLGLLHPHDRGMFESALEEARSVETPVCFEYRVTRPDGTERLVYQQIVSRRDGQGQLLALSGTIQDITERKELSTRLEKLSENIPGFIYQYHLRPDGSSRFPYSSQGIQDLYGLRPEQVREDAGAVFAAVHEEDVKRVANQILISARDLTTWRDQYRVRHSLKGEIWVEGHAMPERLGDGGTLWHGYIWDITDRKRTEDQIRELALFDPLTGLANRRLLRDRLEHALATARRNEKIGAVLMLDLDNFKTLNDTQGHDVGDALLVEVAKRLRESVRESDTVARMGGDEFVAVLESVSRDDLEARDQCLSIAEKIHLALNQPYFLKGSAQSYRTTASIGMALFRGTDTNVDDLLRQADVGMFEAKESGRNRICFFTEERQAAINSRTSLLLELKNALHSDELFLHYQPQVSATGELLGAEALLRWQPPDRDLISPGDFIALAEETGLILPIGEWAFETACRHLRELERYALPDDFAIAVNISPRQFSDGGFLSKVKRAIDQSDVEVRRLKLELTESSLFQDLEHASEVLQELRDLGLRIELDDFGTGYSSLTSLKRLPLDTLKLDGSLVHDIADDERGSAIVRAAIAMAKALSLKVVAEGVETPEQHAFLVREGCEMLQGFLFARPMPFEDFAVQLGCRYARAPLRSVG